MKNIFKISFFVPLAVLGSLFLSACEPRSISSASVSNITSSPSTTVVSLVNYGLRPTENVWPTLPENAGTLATNLLAQNYYIVLDGSGSMTGSGCAGGGNKMDAAKSAVITFAKQLPANANLGLYVFDGSGQSERVTLRENNQAEFIQAVNAVNPNNGTPLYTAVANAYRALEAQAIRQLGYGDFNLVIVTDGVASTGEDPSKAVNEILNISPIVIHTIGFCIGEDHALNQKGATYYRAADDPESLQHGLAAVLAEAPDFKSDRFSGGK